MYKVLCRPNFIMSVPVPLILLFEFSLYELLEKIFMINQREGYI